MPDHHVIVFDEAQRAHDAATVARNHNRVRGFPSGKSEPQLLLEFAGRVPEWSALVCLVGTRQETHVGEEGGLRLWNHALRGLDGRWRVHGPAHLQAVADGSAVPYSPDARLSLDVEVRFHSAVNLVQFVEGLLTPGKTDLLRRSAESLEAAGYHLRITRDLERAKTYLRERFNGQRCARFGLVASSRDGTLSSFGVPNQQDVVRRVKTGPWFVDDEDNFTGLSGRHLRTCMTEFQVQGLELDGLLLAWGTDLILRDQQWDSEASRPHRRNSGVVDPHRLRVNAYRVLLTRAREVLAVFVPPLPALDETYQFLCDAGFQKLSRLSRQDAPERPLQGRRLRAGLPLDRTGSPGHRHFFLA